MATRRVGCRSSSIRVVAVKEVMHSCSTSMSCLDHLIMSAANETLMGLGGRKVAEDCLCFSQPDTYILEYVPYMNCS